MAANQRHKSSGRKSAARGGDSPTRSGKEGEGAYGRLGEVGEQASQYMEQGRSQIRELTRDHEGTAVLVAFAAGFGVGLVIGGLIASSTGRPKTWSERLMAEGIGRRFLERIESILPDAIAERIGG